MVREEASSALASIGAAAVAGLVEALQHEDWLVVFMRWRRWVS